MKKPKTPVQPRPMPLSVEDRAELRNAHLAEVLRLADALDAGHSLSADEARFLTRVLRNYAAALVTDPPRRRAGQSAQVSWYAIAESFALRVARGVPETDARLDLELDFGVSRTTVNLAIKAYPGIVAFGQLSNIKKPE